MQEEFHGDGDGVGYKRFYGWGTINANVWLPSLIELVGYNPDSYTEWNGCYFSAMQGLNTSPNPYVDEKGGEQFSWFQQYNAQGGGTALMNACGQEPSWTRSGVYTNQLRAWRITNPERFDVFACTNYLAVHPARRCKFHISRFRLKGKAKAHSLHCISSPQKGTFEPANGL